jgi:hypothetical protein
MSYAVPVASFGEVEFTERVRRVLWRSVAT